MIEREDFDRHYPVLAYEVGVFMMEHLRRVYREFDGDVALCIVLGEIAHHSTRRFFREMVPRSGVDSRTLATDAAVEGSLKPCNALSIAMASGIPRETVRRKIAKLEALGWVGRDADGGLLYRRKVGNEFREFNWQTVLDLLALADGIRATLRSP